MDEAKDFVVGETAREACQKICRRTIRALQRIRDARLLGDDSGLTNVWEEICAQVQQNESIYWDSYMETIDNVLLPELEKLPRHVLDAVWLQTNPGKEWLCEDASEGRAPSSIDNVSDYVRDEYVLAAAGSWSNSRIRDFIG